LLVSLSQTDIENIFVSASAFHIAADAITTPRFHGATIFSISSVIISSFRAVAFSRFHMMLRLSHFVASFAFRWLLLRLIFSGCAISPPLF